MSEKSTLRAQLKRAWRDTIDQYQAQLINSEHGLQVHFCAALLSQFEASNMKTRRRVFVEPSLRLSVDSVRYPDVVICDTKNVVGIIELKYTPRGRPVQSDLLKDMETLMYASAGSDSLKIVNERFLGEFVTKVDYPLAENAVLCWAGVYRGPDELALNKYSNDDTFLRRFLQLSALTHKDVHPTLYPS
jgi:hypothetical protein